MILGTAATCREQAEGKIWTDAQHLQFRHGAVRDGNRQKTFGDSTVSILAAVRRENPKPVRELRLCPPGLPE